jgi:hypothetical protein
MEIKDKLIRLTQKNKEINRSIQQIRESLFDELVSIMRTRKIVLDQLGQPNLPDELRALCFNNLPRRKAQMYTQEKELILVEKLLEGHKTVLEFSRSAFRELEHKIESFEHATRFSQDARFTMDGRHTYLPFALQALIP